MKKKTDLRLWADLMESDLKFMNDRGWTEAAYLVRYGTTKYPRMGDGGPLIWKADIVAHGQRREQFLAACSRHRRKYGYGPLPDYANELLIEMENIPPEILKFYNSQFFPL